MVAGLPLANGSYGLWIAALRGRQQLRRQLPAMIGVRWTDADARWYLLALYHFRSDPCDALLQSRAILIESIRL